MGRFTDWLYNISKKILKGTRYGKYTETVSQKQIEDEIKKKYPKIGNLTDVGDYITDTVDAFTGKGELDLGRENLDLAKRQQEWNEQFSTKQLEEQQRQFEKSNELAQQNLAYQQEYAEKNFNLQQQSYLDQKAENALMREREDTAYQRQVEDLKQAGLSPLMASNGASSAGTSVGSAPQYDMSGVSTAQGSLIQLAQEYAELRNMAQGNYANRRQNAVNQQIAAREVLAQSMLNRRQQGMNFGMQIANYKMALKDFDIRKRQAEEAIRAAKWQNHWNEIHGNWKSDIAKALYSLASNIGIDWNEVKDALGVFGSNFKNDFNITVQNLEHMYDGSQSGFEFLKNKTEVLKDSKISKASFDDIIAQLSDNNSTISSETIHNWYTSMNEEFQNKFTFGYFYDAINHKSKWKTSTLLKYLMFGNSGNI